jgi:ABC-type amino acid transport substrate-binding protein
MRAAPFMTERRQARELENGTGQLTVMYLSPTPEFERQLLPVRIPIDKNLSGYFVLLIHKADREKFAAVTSVAELKKYRFGLGLGWVDVGILQASGFTVVTGSSYDGLFGMLQAGRFDAFPRSAVEVLDELERHGRDMPDVELEKTLLFSYPLPMYFWFSKSDEGKRLADRVREGLDSMLADGTFEALFERRFRARIRQLQLSKRRVLRILNPNLGAFTPFSDSRLWFDPREEK